MPFSFETLTCDVAVIGAGTAGLAAERSARAAGAATLLIDEGWSGTTCATVGCMPSKLLIAAGNAAHAVREAGRFGVRAAEPVIDGPAVLARVRAERDRFVAGVQRTYEALPAGVALRASACFADRPADARAEGNREWLALSDGRRIAAKAVVIATGSEPHVPPSIAAVADRVLTNASLFELPDLPASLAVLGAGPLGLELAQAMARLGVEVEVYTDGPTIAGLHDAELEPALRLALGREFRIRTGVDCSASPDGSGHGVTLSWAGAEHGQRSFARLLVAAGRRPRLRALRLADARLALDAHGVPRFDRETLQCGARPVFLAGDADGTRAVLHEAAFEGSLAGRNAATFPQVTRRPPAVALAIGFTSPQFATVGRQAPDDASRLVGRASFANQGRATIEFGNVGGVRLEADSGTGRLTGALLVAPGAEHLAHLLAWAMTHGDTASDLLARPFYHPTLEEGLKPALRQICRARPHGRPGRRRGDAPGRLRPAATSTVSSRRRAAIDPPSRSRAPTARPHTVPHGTPLAETEDRGRLPTPVGSRGSMSP